MFVRKVRDISEGGYIGREGDGMGTGWGGWVCRLFVCRLVLAMGVDGVGLPFVLKADTLSID